MNKLLLTALLVTAPAFATVTLEENPPEIQRSEFVCVSNILMIGVKLEHEYKIIPIPGQPIQCKVKK